MSDCIRMIVCDTGADGDARAKAVQSALAYVMDQRGLAERVSLGTGKNRGFRSMGPVVAVTPPGAMYCRVAPDDATEILAAAMEGEVVARLLYQEPVEFQSIPRDRDLPFFSKQVRIALHNCGIVDPESIDEYIAREGYRALGKVLSEMGPEDVIREIKASGLRGRGGAGFLAGMKWELCRKSPADMKYVVCNADEGDPGAFMDRSILESDPHSVLEGMAIAAYAIGAREGYIYCREEYPLAIARLETAIAEAGAYGLLGDKVLGSGFSFDIHLKEGAGAFVCGEETALLASIEGRRGEPRPRPPFPVVSGLWEKPTNINNVKSYAMAPQIVLNGSKWFSSIGSPHSPGTAIFALTGKINSTGLVEVPMGIPLGDIIFDVGGGLPKGKIFKAVQTGGPLGGCLPASSLNTPVDFDSLAEAGAVMGSGGMIVVDDDTCMVEFAKYFLTFAAAESCGKCVPCRIGGQRLLEVLTRITEGDGTRKDLETIRELSQNIMTSSLCGLGQRTPGPIMAALRFFEAEFLSHVDDKLCHAGQCKPLVRAKCINRCPAGVDTPAYLGLIAQGRYAEALSVHRERNPFALICGRACPAFCETKCRRGELDEPVAIRLVKRFMADHEIEREWTPEPIGSPEQRTAAGRKRVAIIGGGPAGLTAGLRLAQRGYGVTVFEKMAVPGGMMSWAIPEYRLPRQPLFLEIRNIQRAGVDIRCNQALGRDFSLDDLFDRHGFDAVILAIGAHRSRRMGIPGEDKKGVIAGIDFLREVAVASCMKTIGRDERGTIPTLRGKRVGCVGGGDVAIDTARTALRLGAREVHVMYRRTGDDMPATHLPEEIEAALHEGIHIHTLVNPIEVLGDKHVTGVRLQRQSLGEFDNSARRKPMPMQSEVYTLNLDYLVPAIGQMPDLSWMTGCKIQTSPSQTLVVNEMFATSRPVVFAAGDAVSGPATIVEAIAHGNKVAASVDHYLRTGDMAPVRLPAPHHEAQMLHNLDAYTNARRPSSPKLPVSQREQNFNEVELGLDELSAQEEAKRCLRCDIEWSQLPGHNGNRHAN